MTKQGYLICLGQSGNKSSEANVYCFLLNMYAVSCSSGLAQGKVDEVTCSQSDILVRFCLQIVSFIFIQVRCQLSRIESGDGSYVLQCQYKVNIASSKCYCRQRLDTKVQKHLLRKLDDFYNFIKKTGTLLSYLPNYSTL